MNRKSEIGNREAGSWKLGRRLRALSGNRSSNAFTLIEMMVVVGILGILMGVAFSGIGQARNQARVARAHTELRQLISAWLSYEAAYDDWPVQVEGEQVEASESALKELLGQNTEQTVYLNAQMVNGAFRDPWGTPYRFRLLPATGDNESTEEFTASVTFPNRHRQTR
jgi:prepilin-type N-terminal cleavage/methylation domain-containing protein